MTKEEAINKVKGYLTDYLPIEDYEELEEIIQALKQEPSVTPAPKEERWIPCTERMPKENEHVDGVAKHYLVQNEYGDMLVARYVKCDYWEEVYKLEPITDKIVAWMPLPDKYKARIEEEEV